MKLPTRLAAVLGVLYGTLTAATTQLHGLSTEAHLAIVFALGVLGALGIHPTDTTTSTPTPSTAAPAAGAPPFPDLPDTQKTLP